MTTPITVGERLYEPESSDARTPPPTRFTCTNMRKKPITTMVRNKLGFRSKGIIFFTESIFFNEKLVAPWRELRFKKVRPG